MFPTLRVCLLLGAVLQLSPPATSDAADDCAHPPNARQPCDTGSCGSKLLTCRPTHEEEDVEKSCYDVECRHICIPPIRFPWEKCCEPKCAKIKAVHVLTKRTWDCKKCVTNWNVDELGCLPGPCDAPACERADQAPVVSPPPPPAPPASNAQAERGWLSRLFR